MKTLLIKLTASFAKLLNFFAFADPEDERKHFGFGQFVLLLTLAPFALSLTLFSFGQPDQVAAYYQHEAGRFTAIKLPALPPKPDDLPKQVRDIARACTASRWALADMHAWGITGPCRAAYNAVTAHAEKLSERNRARFNLPSKPQAQPHETTIRYAVDSFFGEWWQPSSSNHFVGLLLIALAFYIPTAWRCWKQRAFGLLCLGLAIPNGFLLVVLLSLLGFDVGTSWLWMLLLPKIAFAWFALRGRLLSKAFGVAVLLMAVWALFATPHGDDGFIQASFNALLPVFVFVMAMAMARLIVEGAWDNAYLLRNLGWFRSLRTAVHSLGLWLPMALVAGPYFVLTEEVFPQRIVNQLHAGNVLKFDHSHDFLDNALQSAAAKADDGAYAMHLLIESVKRDVTEQAELLAENGLEKRIMEQFDKVMPEHLQFDKVETDIAVIGWAVDEGVKKAQETTNDAYQTLRAEIREKVHAIALAKDAQFREEVLKPGQAKAFDILEEVRSTALQAVLAANRDAQSSLWWAIHYWRAAHQLAMLFFAFICVKSFLYVFARVGFHRDTGTFVTLGVAEGLAPEPVPAQIKPTGHQYLIRPDSGETFYVSRRFQCRGKAPKFAIPQPFHAPIARLLHGATSMNKITMRPGDGAVSCTASQGAEFLEWDLRDGEDVVFDFHNFVGMSDSITISTLVSPRISTLLLGKFIFSKATGPGKLILMTNGRAEITGGDDAAGSLPPERLVAMQANIRLHVESELALVDVYLSTAYVRPAGGGQVIVDVDSQRGSTIGLGRFFKNFLWPG